MALEARVHVSGFVVCQNIKKNVHMAISSILSGCQIIRQLPVQRCAYLHAVTAPCSETLVYLDFDEISGRLTGTIVIT